MEKKLRIKALDIKEGRYEITLNEEDARELGLHTRDRVRVYHNGEYRVASVSISKRAIGRGEAGVTIDLLNSFPVKEGDVVTVVPTAKPKSVEFIRKKMDGLALSESEIDAIIKDVVNRDLSDIEIAAFITALYINGLNMDEAASLSKKMAENGEMLELRRRPVFDKHSIGGVPGNKITLLIVPIVAAAGLVIPKTSSRAITSAAGTADIMEVLAPVSFSAREIEEIVDKTNGIIAWGGGLNLAPADDIFIQVEYPLAIDPHYLALCSVMAKKYAVGADFVVIDIPMGSEAKVKTMEEAKRFAREFIELGERIGISVECAITYGDKPIGRAIGPALEAREALATLEKGSGPSSFVEKSLELAGILLEAGGVASRGSGKEAAKQLLRSGKALKKMKEIIAAQGGDEKIKAEDIRVGEYREVIKSEGEGYVIHISNRALVRIAREAGSPKDKGAGILLHITKGEKVRKGDVLMEIYAESEYRLEQAVKLAKQLKPITLEGMVLARVPGITYFEH
jgi:AMP phosphorylase